MLLESSEASLPVSFDRTLDGLPHGGGCCCFNPSFHFAISVVLSYAAIEGSIKININGYIHVSLIRLVYNVSRTYRIVLIQTFCFAFC